ncbi:MAG TPA: hypothetical protein VJZ00_06870 [Thermoanaerobaculia bacterium]|nr:hypothetical protein [Thermoanaerobaculia bacterium]
MPTIARSVLLIERDDSIRDAIAMRLRRAGFRLASVSDALTGAVLLSQREFDVTVGDRDVRDQLGDCATGAFTVIDRPPDFEELISSVRSHAARRQPAVNLDTVQRFVASIPRLRDTLTSPTPNSDELLLHGEIRRAIGELSGVLEAAANHEPDRTRAALFRSTSAAAADLAAARRRKRWH